MEQNNTQAKGFPWSHVFGFVLSLALTFGAVFIALETTLPFSTIFTVIIVMAIAQALLQLIMFMHLNEGEGAIQILTMVYSFFIAATIIVGSVWIFFSM